MILEPHHVLSIVSNFYGLSVKELQKRRSRYKEPFTHRKARVACLHFLRSAVGLSAEQAMRELNIRTSVTVERYEFIADPSDDLVPLNRIVNSYITAVTLCA